MVSVGSSQGSIPAHAVAFYPCTQAEQFHKRPVILDLARVCRKFSCLSATGTMIHTGATARAQPPAKGNQHVSNDLSSILRDWPYESGQINVRLISGDDGEPKVQMRLDLGLLQMEAFGRPDGERPQGYEPPRILRGPRRGAWPRLTRNRSANSATPTPSTPRGSEESDDDPSR